jgi:hypothetical protein
VGGLVKKLIIINYGLCCRKKKGKTEKKGDGGMG